MLQMYMGDFLLLGITKRNLEKLVDGQPILMEVRAKEPLKTISIMYGEDKVAILEELKKSGVEVPQWMMDSAMSDPL